MIITQLGINLNLLVTVSSGDEDSLKNILAGDGTLIKSHIGGWIEFWLTFFLSVFSASLGLAKCLKNGVARPIGAGGCLDGLLSARHLLAFFACGLCLGARGWCLGIVTDNATAPFGEVSNHFDENIIKLGLGPASKN